MNEPTIAETAGWKPTGADPAAPLKEFYAPPAGPKLGRPEDDLPFTIRIQPPWTWERRHDPATPRAVKFGDEGVPAINGLRLTWTLITGFDPENKGRVAGRDLWTSVQADRGLHDNEVRDWPIQHPVAVEAAMAKLRREKPQERPAPELVGDMDVEAFKGGADG
jgi:hypothetical protein